MNKPKCVLIYGPPASGKSTLAKEYEARGYVSVERDKIRKNLYGLRSWKDWDWNNEENVTRQWDFELNLAIHYGFNIVISDTLCGYKKRKTVVDRIVDAGYDLEIIPLCPELHVLLERDSKRGDMAVGEKVIKQMWRTFNE